MSGVVWHSCKMDIDKRKAKSCWCTIYLRVWTSSCMLLATYVGFSLFSLCVCVCVLVGWPAFDELSPLVARRVFLCHNILCYIDYGKWIFFFLFFFINKKLHMEHINVFMTIMLWFTSSSDDLVKNQTMFLVQTD